MAKTLIGIGDPKAVKRYSALLATDTAKKGYWTSRFFGTGESASAPVHQHNELENSAGDLITYDLSVQLAGQGVEGDDTLEGNEEKLTLYTDSLYINQRRHAVDTGGAMTRKRTIHNLRDIAKRRLSDWWARLFDEMLFQYASGARGVNSGFIDPTSYAGFANNSFTAPDSDHLIVGGGAKASLDSADKMSLNFIDVAKTNAQMMGGDSSQTPQIQPVKIDGEDHFVCVMSPWQAYDLRTATGETGWLAIQKAAAASTGKASPIFKGALGMHNGVVLHEHSNVIRFSDYGSGGNVAAARALFLGDQALTMAFGSPGTGMRFSWKEEPKDYDNDLGVAAGTIFGIKKTTFEGKDYGVIAIDTAAAAPSVA